MTVSAQEGAEKEEAGYDFYPDRRHLHDEFNALWDAQAEHHAVLADELRDGIDTIIFHQRPLKMPKVGKCLFIEEERRFENPHCNTIRYDSWGRVGDVWTR